MFCFILLPLFREAALMIPSVKILALWTGLLWSKIIFIAMASLTYLHLLLREMLFCISVGLLNQGIMLSVG